MGHAKHPCVVIVGGGFGGLSAAKALRNVPASVTIVDRTNHHLFQPLLYQVATAGLSPADIASPIRRILRSQKNVDIVLAEARGISPDEGKLLTDGPDIDFDYLILATGSSHSYFGHDDWAELAPGLKSLDDATHIRSQILLAFENAEKAEEVAERESWLSIVIVGGGPTGVELAGSIVELADRALVNDFDHISPDSAKIILIEATDRVLSGFSQNLSKRAKSDLDDLGVDVRTNTKVVAIEPGIVQTDKGPIRARTILWAAGVQASDSGKWLGADVDRQGRILVDDHLQTPPHRNIFAIGDLAHVVGEDGKPLPAVAQPAIQQGKFVAELIRRRIEGQPDPPPFRYKNLGIMATIGRRRAIVQFPRLQFAGTIAWLMWVFLHLWQLIGFRNKLVVLFQWIWAYVTFERGARLITGRKPQ